MEEEPKTSERSDASSPNGIIACIAIAACVAGVLCGTMLWIPPSRIGNLYLRSIVLAAADAGAAFARWTTLDRPVPRAREAFLSATGLDEHPSWDSRYFNRRGGEGKAALAEAPGAEASPRADGTASADGVLDIDAAGVAAAASDSTATASQPPKPASVIHSSENPLRVFVFGDSQVFSLGSGLSRLSGKGGAIDVETLAIHSSGFIRSDYYDWPAKIEDTFRASPFEAAVLMLGMNDYQNFYGADGKVLRKRTPEWEAAYAEKCRALVDLVLAFVPRVYWVGMPLVKNEAYAESLAYIDGVQAKVAAEYSPLTVVRVSLTDAVPGPGKPYADTLEVEGRRVAAMSSDGIHYTVEGGQLAMLPLFRLLSADYPFSEGPEPRLPGEPGEDAPGAAAQVTEAAPQPGAARAP